MTVWNASTVDEQPFVQLSRWRFLRTETGCLHLVGYRADRGTGRVSTAVTEFDGARRCARTSSGRAYVLDGPHGYSQDAEYVWCAWTVANGVESWEDVTEAVLAGGIDAAAAVVSRLH